MQLAINKPDCMNTSILIHIVMPKCMNYAYSRKHDYLSC